MKGIVWNFEMFYLLTWLAFFLDYLVQVVTSRGHSTSTILNPFHHLHSYIHHLDYSYRHLFWPWYYSLPPCDACWSGAPCVVWKKMLLANSAVAWFLLPWPLLFLLKERCFIVSQIVSAIWVPNSEESVFVDAASHSASCLMQMTHSTVARDDLSLDRPDPWGTEDRPQSQAPLSYSIAVPSAHN